MGKSSNVLVAIVPRKKDWRILEEKHWYRIPVKSAPKMIERVELLPDEPNHTRANEDYYKFTIDELKKLPRPIPSKRWRRIIFIPTTLNKLMEAKEINDLYHTSPIEEKLYKALKRRKIPAERQFLVCETKEPYCLDFAVFCKSGKLDIECDGDKYHSSKKARERDRKRNNELTAAGWSILRFSGSEIHKNPKACIRQIKKAIKSLKGLTF